MIAWEYLFKVRRRRLGRQPAVVRAAKAPRPLRRPRPDTEPRARLTRGFDERRYRARFIRKATEFRLAAQNMTRLIRFICRSVIAVGLAKRIFPRMNGTMKRAGLARMVPTMCAFGAGYGISPFPKNSAASCSMRRQTAERQSGSPRKEKFPGAPALSPRSRIFLIFCACRRQNPVL